MSNVRWTLKPDGAGGWAGEIIMVTGAVPGGGAVSTFATGPTKATALLKASGLAEQLMGNELVAALMPPQAQLAVKAIKVLSKGAAAGRLEEVASQFAGPAIDRLGKALGGLF